MVGMVFLLFLSNMRLISGQLAHTERLRNITQCDLSSEFNIACGTGETIVLHSIKLAYRDLCEFTCCTYNSLDCFADYNVDSTLLIRRTCSGRQGCTVPLVQEMALFCEFGVKYISYAFLQYYCIPGSRTISICASGKTLTSDGLPLYITNENYPGVTIGNSSCACSIEANSCSSSITVYEADIDLYLDTNNCQQHVVFKNGTGDILTTYGCESYYTEYITSRAINSYYSRIEFNNNSTANVDGVFLFGLTASEEGVSFSISCSSEPETRCVGCGSLPNITNGILNLRNKGDTSYGAIADVSCNDGYETNTSTVSCKEYKTWQDGVCTAKDCGPAPVLKFGNVILHGVTTYGSTATVRCETGYEPNITIITCLALGQWEKPECNIRVADTTTPQTGNIQKPSIDIVLVIIIGTVVVVILIQLSIVTFFQCKIYSIRKNASDEQAAMPKCVSMIVLGSVPVLGIIAIYLSGRMFYKDLHRVNHGLKDSMHSNERGNGSKVFKNVPADDESFPMS